MFAMGEESGRVLGKVVLGYSPVIDRREGVIATRLTVVPLRVGVTPDADALLRTIGEVWPEQGGPVVLNVSSELSGRVDACAASAQRDGRDPLVRGAEPANASVLRELAARGNPLLLKGRPARELPREGAALLQVVAHRLCRRPPSRRPRACARACHAAFRTSRAACARWRSCSTASSVAPSR